VCKYNHCSNVGLTVTLQEMTQTTDYLGCQHINEKLSDQPIKNYRFFSHSYRTVGKFSECEEYIAKDKKNTNLQNNEDWL
jgi:hypothetical protein